MPPDWPREREGRRGGRKIDERGEGAHNDDPMQLLHLAILSFPAQQERGKKEKKKKGMRKEDMVKEDKEHIRRCQRRFTRRGGFAEVDL